MSDFKAVGMYYDQKGPFWSIIWGNNLHVGCWPPGKENLSVQEAQIHLTDMAIDRLQVGPGQRVLDVGCGTGGPGVRLAERTGCEVVGITVSVYQVEQANALAKAKGLDDRVQFRYGNAMQMPFESGSFDAVWTVEALSHMDHAKVLQEIYRVLRLGGQYVLTDITAPKNVDSGEMPEEQQAIFGAVYGIPSLDALDNVEELMQTTGFEIDEILDLSEQTKPTIAKSLEIINQKHNELVKAYGPAFTETIVQATNIFTQIFHLVAGYVLVSARKPDSS